MTEIATMPLVAASQPRLTCRMRLGANFMLCPISPAPGVTGAWFRWRRNAAGWEWAWLEFSSFSVRCRYQDHVII